MVGQTIPVADSDLTIDNLNDPSDVKWHSILLKNTAGKAMPKLSAYTSPMTCHRRAAAMVNNCQIKILSRPPLEHSSTEAKNIRAFFLKSDKKLFGRLAKPFCDGLSESFIQENDKQFHENLRAINGNEL